MYYYFSCAFPSIIKINGIYYGQIHKSVKFINIPENLSPFVEICSLSDSEKDINFFLDQAFLSSPKSRTSVTDLKGGYLINFLGEERKSTFNVLCQKKTNAFNVTVFYEETLKVSVQTERDFYVDNIFFDAVESQVYTFCQSQYQFVAVLFKGKSDLLSVYNITDKISRVFFSEVSCFSTENFNTVRVYKDIENHKINSYWEFKGEKFIEKEKKVEKLRAVDIESVNPKIIPYLFLEDFLLTNDVERYLASDLQAMGKELANYLGGYIGIFPPPQFRKENEIGLIYKQEKNSYYANYFTFELDGRKINNIVKSEN